MNEGKLGSRSVRNQRRSVAQPSPAATSFLSKIRDVDFSLDCVPTGTADRTTASTAN